MALTDYVHTFGQYLLLRNGERIHKFALDEMKLRSLTWRRLMLARVLNGLKARILHG